MSFHPQLKGQDSKRFLNVLRTHSFVRWEQWLALYAVVRYDASVSMFGNNDGLHQEKAVPSLN